MELEEGSLDDNLERRCAAAEVALRVVANAAAGLRGVRRVRFVLLGSSASVAHRGAVEWLVDTVE